MTVDKPHPLLVHPLFNNFSDLSPSHDYPFLSCDTHSEAHSPINDSKIYSPQLEKASFYSHFTLVTNG